MTMMRFAGAAAVLLCVPLWGQQAAAPDASARNTAALEQKIRNLRDSVVRRGETANHGKSASRRSSAGAGSNRCGSSASVGRGATQSQATASVPPPAAAETQAGIAAQASAEAVTVGGGSAAASKALNADISVIGDFIGAVGGNTPPPLATLQPLPSLEMHESEIGMQAIIDPYARGDFFVSFGEEGVNLEEGYITFTALPAGFVAKVGKMRSAFGKVNTMHNHVLPWVDRPLVSTNLVGGEDGIDDAGFSGSSAFCLLLKGFSFDATAQVFPRGLGRCLPAR